VSDTGQIRIALAQINPTVGDLSKNADLISKYAFDAANAGAVVVVYPEMVLTGYPVEDLANRASFRAASIAAVEKLAVRINSEGNGDLTLLVGYLGQNEAGRPQNCVAVIYRGEIMATYIKHHLPNYGVFDEYRNFAPGNHSLVIRVCGVDIGIAICEDIWQAGGPVAELAKRNIGLLLVPNGSPFELNKDGAKFDKDTNESIEYITLQHRISEENLSIIENDKKI
jgi:NAD+ synthase (glutamine-hydrolysing)